LEQIEKNLQNNPTIIPHQIKKIMMLYINLIIILYYDVPIKNMIISEFIAL